MHFSTVAAVLACASSALAYTVTSPNSVAFWTNQGPQKAEWSRAGTDPVNVTVVLTNNDTTLMSAPQILLALVQGDDGKANLNPPSAGWPTPGPGYVLNLVRSVNELDSVLAQSQKFEIKEPNVTTTTSSSSTSSTPLNSITAAGAIPTDTTVDNPGSSDTKGNGAGALVIPAGLLAAFAFIPALLL
jgi:hypothetical protein